MRLSVLSFRLMLLIGAAQALSVGADAATDGTNKLRSVTLAVLPLNNATGDPSLDYWSHGFAELLEMRLGSGQGVSDFGRKQVYGAMTNAGWRTNSPVDRKIAERAERELEADVIVWGEFGRWGGQWELHLGIVQADRTNQSPQKSFRYSSINELLTRAPLGLADLLELKIPREAQRKWEKIGSGPDGAWDQLARFYGMRANEAPVAEQENLLRQLIAGATDFVPARVCLSELLAMEGRNGESEVEVRRVMPLAPEWCGPHLMLGGMLIETEKLDAARKEFRKALELHPGCPHGCEGLYLTYPSSDPAEELRAILEKANGDVGGDVSTGIFLAAARVRCGDIDGAERLLEQLTDFRSTDSYVHAAAFEAQLGCKRLRAATDELLWFQKWAEKGGQAAHLLGMIDDGFWLGVERHKFPVTRPKSYTPEELKRELQTKLSSSELVTAVNPLEMTPEIVARAKELTRGITNQAIQAILIFREVAQLGRGKGNGGVGIRTAPVALKMSKDPEVKFSCQEYAKVFVTLARAAGLEAWLTHIDETEDGNVAYHDCAALFLGNNGYLVDPTWAIFGAGHRKFRVLSDIQAIAHQAMQGEPPVVQLRAGKKLDPDDPWTHLQLVKGLGLQGMTQEAEYELSKLGTNHTTRWDYHMARAAIAASRERWPLMLSALQEALLLSPSNPVVHLQLGNAYHNAGNFKKAQEHLGIVERLDRNNALNRDTREARFRLELERTLAQAQSKDVDSLESIRKRAKAGDASAQFAMAQKLIEGNPRTMEAIKEGMEWLRQAAEQGNDEFQRLYGKNLLALYGRERAVDAAEWFTRSAKQGNASAQVQLAKILFYEKLVPRDEVTACQWAILASNSGDREARMLLKEMEIFMDKKQLEEGRRRAAEFKAKK